MSKPALMIIAGIDAWAIFLLLLLTAIYRPDFNPILTMAAAQGILLIGIAPAITGIIRLVKQTNAAPDRAAAKPGAPGK